MDKRGFLQVTASAGAAALSGCVSASGGSTPPARTMPAVSDGRACLPMTWRKHGIAVHPSESWEGGHIQNFNSTAEPLGDGRWRVWYSVNLPREAFKTIAIAEGIPGQAMVKHQAVLSSGDPADAPLAIGNLPRGWQPVQPVHLLLRDGRQRLYFWAHDIAHRVQRFLVAESTDGRRYRVLDPANPSLYSFRDRDSNQVPAGRRSNDAATVYQLGDQTFEMYVQTLIPFADRDWPRYAAHDNVAGYRRAIDRLVSEDGIQFTDRKRILEADEFDPPDLQFYYLTVTHTERGRVGFLGRYPVQSQYIELECCLSSDGVTWQRPYRTSWLPRGNPFEPDCYAIYPANASVEVDGQWWLFYTGVNFAHNDKHSYGKPSSCVMWATSSIWT